jgi:glycosyltransferase involved in cell wall biosynthesis
VLLVASPNVRIEPRDGEHVLHLVDSPECATRWYWRKRAYLLEDFRRDPRVATTVRTLHQKNKYNAFFGRYHLPFLADAARLGPTFVDVDDLPTESWRSPIPFVDQIRSLAFNRALRPLKTVFLAKRADVGKVRHSDIRVLPCISTRPDETGPIGYGGSQQRMLFVGGTAWPPNREGISRFIEKCLPLIREEIPDAVLRVVGAEGRRVAGPPGVSADNFVPDIASEYRQAAVVICPIYRGTGATVKLAEAAGYGRAIVATPFAARGYEGFLQPGRDLAIGESEEQLANHCVNLLRDGALRDRLGKNAADAARVHLSQVAVDTLIRDAVAPWLMA